MPAFDGKVAVITGAANGIGAATAEGFASRGAKVLLADIDVDQGEAVARRITGDGGTASFLRTDVSVPADVEAMVAAALDRYGRLDYAHNNAGIVGGGATVVDMPVETWNQGIGVMLTGVFLCLKYEIPAALEFATSGVRINAVCPGTARSKMVDEWIGGDPAQEAQVAALHPIGRIAEAEEIASAVLWLCSDAASFMIGHAMVVDGGYTIQ